MNKVESALSRTTDTKALVIGTDTLPQVAEMFRKLFPDKRALVVADASTWRVAGDDVHKILAGAGVAQDEPYVFTDPKLYAEWAYVGELDTVLAETDAVPVAVGSGVINDLTKLCSSHNGRRYMVVGTAASMDGYTAYGASITKDGNKQTFDCPAPLGMVLDSNTRRGCACEALRLGLCRSDRQDPGRCRLDAGRRRRVGVDGRLRILGGAGRPERGALRPGGRTRGECRQSGTAGRRVAAERFAMQATQSSRPASGAEHQFSHLWDMEHLKYNGASVSHGFKVGIGTLASTAFLEMLLEAPVGELDVEKCVAAWKSWEETEADIRRIFDNDPEFVARGLVETKGKYVDKEGLRRQLQRLKKAWPELSVRIRRQIIRRESPPPRAGRCALRTRADRRIACQVPGKFRKIPYMRSRFTVIDIASVAVGWNNGSITFGKGGIGK